MARCGSLSQQGGVVVGHVEGTESTALFFVSVLATITVTTTVAVTATVAVTTTALHATAFTVQRIALAAAQHDHVLPFFPMRRPTVRLATAVEE
jgi:hypothetical protein